MIIYSMPNQHISLHFGRDIIRTMTVAGFIQLVTKNTKSKGYKKRILIFNQFADYSTYIYRHELFKTP